MDPPPGKQEEQSAPQEEEEEEEEVEEVDDSPGVPQKSMPATMVLVIGIILGAFILMVLIVIIVLKMRTRVDVPNKCDGDGVIGVGGMGPGGPLGPGVVGHHPPNAAAPRYQFAPAAQQTDFGDLGRPDQVIMMQSTF